MLEAPVAPQFWNDAQPVLGGASFAAVTVSSVVVVDRHPVIRAGVSAILSADPTLRIVAETASLAEAVQSISALRPHAVVLDLDLADGHGLDLCREIRLRLPATGVVVLTADDSDENLLAALDAGASAFVAKSAPAAEIVLAVRNSVVAPRTFFAAGLAQALAHRAQATARPVLSARETEVLRLFQQGRSIPEVAATLYVSISTAKTYVARLYEKLGACNRAQALMTAVQMGLLDAHDYVVPVGAVTRAGRVEVAAAALR